MPNPTSIVLPTEDDAAVLRDVCRRVLGLRMGAQFNNSPNGITIPRGSDGRRGRGAGPVVVKVTTAETGGGKYGGRILTGAADENYSQDLAMPEGMTVPDADDALVFYLLENGTSAHGLPVDGTCYVAGVLIGATTETPSRTIVLGFGVLFGTTVVCKITGAGAGGGKYNGRILTGTMTASGSAGDLALPAGMTVPGADDALIYHLLENGASGHGLPVDGTCYAVGVVTGRTSEATPRYIVTATSTVAGGSTYQGLFKTAAGWAPDWGRHHASP